MADPIRTFCDALTRAVVSLAPTLVEADLDHAVEALRRHAKAAILNPRAGSTVATVALEVVADLTPCSVCGRQGDAHSSEQSWDCVASLAGDR